jgi:hypothetical protein
MLAAMARIDRSFHSHIGALHGVYNRFEKHISVQSSIDIVF